MKKILLTCTILMSFCSIGLAQYSYSYSHNVVKSENKSKFDPRKIVYGGGFGLAFGSNSYWNVALSPQIGYELTDKFVTGVGMTYSHSSERYNTWGGGREKHTQNYVGVNLFAHYYPTSWSVLTLKPEGIRVWDSYSGGEEQEEFIPAVVLGAGIRFKPIFITLNYDVVQNERNPYGDNIFWSVGFFF